jgi:hypothetical protein
MGDFADTFLKRFSVPTAMLLQLGTALIAVFAGVPKDQFVLALGTTGAAAAKEIDSESWWARQLIATLLEAAGENTDRILCVVVIVAAGVALVVSKDKASRWMARSDGRRWTSFGVALLLMAGCSGFAIRFLPTLQGPLILAGLTEGQMEPRAFGEAGKGATRAEAIASDMYARLHGVSLERPLGSRSKGANANYCKCPTMEDYENVVSRETVALFLTLASTLVLICLSFLPTLLGAAFLNQDALKSRVPAILTCALAVPVVLHMCLWYLGAENLGTLEAVKFLRDDTPCPFNENSIGDARWPFCKPDLSIESVSPKRFLASNVWPILDREGEHAEIRVKLHAVDAPIRLPVPIAGRSFRPGEHGKLELDFGPEDLPRLVAPHVEPATDALLFDGQATAEISLQ